MDGRSTVEDEVDEVRPGVRRALHWFLLVVAVCGLAHLELWPLTGFRLFSEVRTRHQAGWSIVAVDHEGGERTIRLLDLPVAYRNTTKVIPGLAHRSAEARDEVCRAWAGPLRERGQDVALVRVYATVTDAFPGGAPQRRHLEYECGRAR